MNCPKCKKQMILRPGKYGKFYGCVGYPECKETRDYDASKDESLNQIASTAPTGNGDHLSKIDSLLREKLSEASYNFWLYAKKELPMSAMSRPTSSSGKYHQRTDGSVPSTAEHTYEMLYAASRIARMFGDDKKSDTSDVLYVAIALHDALKYGSTGTQPHTSRNHDKLIGDWVNKAWEDKKLPLDFDPNLLEDCVRFHSGRWSTDNPIKSKAPSLSIVAHFVHVLDMLSTASLIRLPGE